MGWVVGGGKANGGSATVREKRRGARPVFIRVSILFTKVTVIIQGDCDGGCSVGM